jgi:hypothetical protein
MRWVAEGRFTNAYTDGERQVVIKAGQAPTLFRRIRQAGEETLALFLEPEGSLAKAVASLASPRSYRNYVSWPVRKTSIFISGLDLSHSVAVLARIQLH